MVDITKSMDRMTEDKIDRIVDFSKLTGSSTRLPAHNENILK